MQSCGDHFGEICTDQCRRGIHRKVFTAGYSCQHKRERRTDAGGECTICFGPVTDDQIRFTEAIGDQIGHWLIGLAGHFCLTARADLKVCDQRAGPRLGTVRGRKGGVGVRCDEARTISDRSRRGGQLCEVQFEAAPDDHRLGTVSRLDYSSPALLERLSYPFPPDNRSTYSATVGVELFVTKATRAPAWRNSFTAWGAPGIAWPDSQTTPSRSKTQSMGASLPERGRDGDTRLPCSPPWY
jgi:hypothetical protein